MPSPDPSTSPAATGFASSYRKPSADGVRRRHALLVGIDAYDDPDLRLSYCVSDVTRLASVLESRGVAVTVLRDGLPGELSPTRDNIRRALAALVARADEDDVLCVHFSCHGVLLDGRPYLLASDTPGGEQAARDKGLALAEVLTILRGAPRWVAIFLDACHMGLGLDPETVLSTAHGTEKNGGFALLAGSTEGQITQDSEVCKGGVFTDALVRGLGGAAADPDGSVRFSALAHFVQREVAAWRASAEGRAKLSTQTPVLRLEVSDLSVLPSLGFVLLDPGHVVPPGYVDLSPKIRAAAFSPDGRALCTVSEDATARLWSLETGKQLLQPMGHNGHVGGVCYSPDGINLATACNDGQLRLWQAPGASLLMPMPPPLRARVHAVAWSPVARLFAAVSDLGAHLYDPLAPAKPVRELAQGKGTIWAVAFTPDGKLVTGGGDGNVRLWDVKTGVCKKAFTHEGPVWAVAVSPDGRFIAAAGADAKPSTELKNLPRQWEISTGKAAVRHVGHEQAVTALAYSPDGAWLASSSYDGSGRLWSTADGRPLASFRPEPRSEAYGVCFAPDVKRPKLFVGHADGRGRIYDLSHQVADRVAPVG
ncbi:MAG: caspase family protein [Byssovorax sp.]